MMTKVAGDRTKLLAKFSIQVNLKELALKISILLTLKMDFDYSYIARSQLYSYL